VAAAASSKLEQATEDAHQEEVEQDHSVGAAAGSKVEQATEEVEQDHSVAASSSRVEQLAEERVDFWFSWPRDAHDVQVAGSFNDWELLSLERNSCRVFSQAIRLPKGFHQCKFVVDGIWMCHPWFPTMQEGQFENNYIIVAS